MRPKELLGNFVAVVRLNQLIRKLVAFLIKPLDFLQLPAQSSCCFLSTQFHVPAVVRFGKNRSISHLAHGAAPAWLWMGVLVRRI